MGGMRLIGLVIGAAAMVMMGGCASEAIAPSGKVNVAEWGTARVAAGEGGKATYTPKLNDGRADTAVDVGKGQMVEIEWREPRDVREVVVRGTGLPRAEDIGVQYWYRIWPDNGSGGWQKLDDPFNGKWVTAKAEGKAEGGAITYVMSALGKEENPEVKAAGLGYRRTYKARLVFGAAARVSEVEVRTGAVWKTAELKLEWRVSEKKKEWWEGKVEARNGRVARVSPRGATRGPVAVKVHYADAGDRLSEDRGYVIFRSEGWQSFSVFVDDVVREGGIYVRGIDAFVSDAGRGLSYRTRQRPADAWDATVMEKVGKLPEQSLEGVSKAIPIKPPREAHLGVANMRQEFTIWPNGDIGLLVESLRSAGRDLERRPWTEAEIRYRIWTGERPGEKREAKRYLEEGWLPVIHTEWKTGEVEYRQAALATVLRGGIGQNEDGRRGDEPLVLLSRIDMRNGGSARQRARVWVEVSKKAAMRLGDDGVMVLEAASDRQARAGLTPVRGRIDADGKGAVEYVAEQGMLRYEVELGAREKHAVYLNVPYVELLDDAEMSALKRVRFDRQHDEVVEYWKKRIGRGMAYETPEKVLNDLFKANLWHVLISTDRDPASGLYEHGAATMHYGNFANETCMVAQSLEMRGEHEEARRLIEPFLVSQGTKGLPGRFVDKKGVLYSAYPSEEKDPYTAQGYNMHPGWVLRAAAEHYKWTEDGAYLKAVMPKLIAGCDWIARQRATTKVANEDGARPVEWGLAPAGDLEDVEEYLYWYATNAYYYAGMKAADEVLGEAGSPDAMRVGYEAEEYKADILASLREAVASSPVVKLRDGSYTPYVPSRAYVRTHLKEGWIREALYSSLHLLEAGVVESNHPAVTWLLEDLEDNIYLSKESGYGVEKAAENYFNFGGFTLQPNLLPNAMAHLRRDEIPHFLRVFYNTLWASLYPDTMCFAEWVKYYGSGNGPLYKTPDECVFVQMMRNMLIMEQGQTIRTLRLGTGVPRAWMTDGKVIRVERAATLYGPMDMTIRSEVGKGRIVASIKLPRRRPADVVLLRLRHPEGKELKRVTVNGKEWDKVSRAMELVVLPGEMEEAEVVGWYGESSL